MDERLRVFGTEFLQYTLCVANEIEEEGQLSPAQEEAAQVLLEFITKTSKARPAIDDQALRGSRPARSQAEVHLPPDLI
ncbi:hypothetical protein, partial [Streptomyces sp. S.PB5]|uniref:hypothetical protein n=1 Tax=Streptomyces sp. S.PB5 TaxID=3020844 RepID=UPI0025AF073D